MTIKIKLILLLTASLSMGIVIYFFNDFFSCYRIKCISFKESNQYTLKSIYEENKYTYRALYGNGVSLLRTEVKSGLTKEEANEAIQVQITRTKGLFEDAPAPYPGEISDVVGCSNIYKPVYSSVSKNGISISYFEGYLNNRLVLGSCVDDQAVYHNTFSMFYCLEQKKYYQLEFIIPTKDYRENRQQSELFLNSLKCR